MARHDRGPDREHAAVGGPRVPPGGARATLLNALGDLVYPADDPVPHGRSCPRPRGELQPLPCVDPCLPTVLAPEWSGRKHATRLLEFRARWLPAARVYWRSLRDRPSTVPALVEHSKTTPRIYLEWLSCRLGRDRLCRTGRGPTSLRRAAGHTKGANDFEHRSDCSAGSAGPRLHAVRRRRQTTTRSSPRVPRCS
jgi:hypothetical protein